MSEDTFRMVVAAGVLIASLAFVVQAGVILALFRLTRKMHDTSAGFIEGVGPMLAKVEPMLAKVEPVLAKVGPVFERIGPAIDQIERTAAKFGPAMDRFLPVVDKTAVAVERVGVFMQSASQTALSANQVLNDLRPRIAEISGETASIVRSGREQVERLGDLLQDAGERTKARLEQVDQTVGATVEQIENVSNAVKSAVLRPVREVNGLAAGISAAVSAMVRGQRKSSVDSATQDEEMFI